MNAGELFQAGKLQEAIAEAIQQVKARPEDMSQRTLLFSLLCFEGDLSRAKKQIEVVDHQATLSEAAAYANLLAAEETRRRVLNEGLQPKFFDPAPARAEKHLQAICRMAAGQIAEAYRWLELAEDERPETSGILNGEPFDDFADANDVTRSFLEFQQGREYYWVPFEQLAHLQVLLPEPARPRDLYWAPCQLILKSGATQRGFTPAIYSNSYQSSETDLKLGHGTHFENLGDGVYRGLGRKQFVAGEKDPSIFDLKDVSFN